MMQLTNFFLNCLANARKRYGFKTAVQLLMFTSDYMQSPLFLELEKDRYTNTHTHTHITSSVPS
jgi:hypothetical protein